MPIYEYQCSQCGHQLETIQKITDEPLKECPQCGKASLNKLISATSFQLKGTGWYATDFRDKGKPPKPDETKKTESTSTDKKSDDKKQNDSGSSSSTDKAAG